MTLEDFINKIESDYLEEALALLKKNPKDLITAYLNVKEYQRAKLMRANFIPEEDNKEKSIKITIVK